MLLNHWSHMGGKLIPISPGIIAGFNSAGGAPDGWEDFSAADGKSLRAATDDNDVGSSSSGSGSKSVTSTISGGHNGAPLDFIIKGRTASSDTYVDQTHDYAWYGNHDHTITIGYTVKRSRVRLIRATTLGNSFPANALLLSSSGEIEGCLGFDTFNDFGGILTGNGSIATSAASSTATCTTSSASHDHITTTSGSRTSGTGYGQTISAHSMSHAHSVTKSVSVNLYRATLKVWEATAELREKSDNLIAMYNGEGVPPGWNLCDGTNGTIDLRNRFINCSNSAGVLTDGSNTLSASGNLSSWSHAHSYTTDYALTGTVVGHISAVAHDHSYSLSTSWVPPWYKLKFIQLGA